MDIVHTKITFEDQFSFSKTVRETTVSKPTFDKMQADIGKIVPIFDKKQQINYTFKIINVEQI